MKLFKASDLTPVIGGMDTEKLIKSSRRARFGLRFVQAGVLLLQCSMLFAAVALCAVMSAPTLAQSVLGNDASRPVKLAKRAIDVLAWGMILLGVGGIARAIYTGINGQQGWGRLAVFGAGGLGFGFVVSWINAEVNGNEVALPEP
jgi:hypothetical protein